MRMLCTFGKRGKPHTAWCCTRVPPVGIWPYIHRTGLNTSLDRAARYNDPSSQRQFAWGGIRHTTVTPQPKILVESTTGHIRSLESERERERERERETERERERERGRGRRNHFKCEQACI